MYRPHVVQELRRGKKVLAADEAVEELDPRRVIRPETAASLRRLMEGVVLNGTGFLARLDGWTAAGKTGSAQKIDPATGRYSPKNFIASFTGFAPINNPAVAILVSIDSPVGLHEGGPVAAPVFKRIAEQVLPYMEVPRDVQLNPRLIQAAYRKQAAADAESLEDFTSTDFSGQPDRLLEESNQGVTVPPPAPPQHVTQLVTTVEESGGDIEVPDFSGKTMREVSEMCVRLGLDPVLVGSNLATDQTPAAGATVKRGAKVTVQFGTLAVVKQTNKLQGGPSKAARVRKASKR
jgi:membrane peptidoglycan carboxypeptidase